MHGSDAQTSIFGSHEPENGTESDQFPAVSGSGERKKTLQAIRRNNMETKPRNTLNSTATKRQKLHPEKLPVADESLTDDLDSDSDNSDDCHDQRFVYSGPKVDPKLSTSISVSGSGRHSRRHPDTSEYESSQSDDADSQSSESESHSEKSDSESGTEYDEISNPLLTSELPKSMASKRVVYFRANSALSEESFAETKQALQKYLPDTEILLEIGTNHKTPYSERRVLNALMSQIVNGEISEVLVADSNHLCSTKDGFSVFNWVCQQFRTKVFILPALQSL